MVKKMFLNVNILLEYDYYEDCICIVSNCPYLMSNYFIRLFKHCYTDYSVITKYT